MARYQLQFQSFLDHIDQNSAKKRLAKLLNLSDETLDLCLNDQPNPPLYKNLSETEASILQTKLADIGIQTEVTIMSNPNERDTFHQAPLPKNSNKAALVFTIPMIIGLAALSGFLYMQIGKLTESNATLEERNYQHVVTESNLKKENINLKENLEKLGLTNIDHEQIVPGCLSEGSESTVTALVTEHFPNHIKKDNPELNLTYKALLQGEELYFDAGRNKRLCRLIVSYDAINEASETEEIAMDLLFESTLPESNKLNLSVLKYGFIGKVVRDAIPNNSTEPSTE